MIKNWLIGLAAAVVAALVVYGIARATGDDLMVTQGASEPIAIPIVAVPFATISSGLAALLVAWLLKRVPRPRMTWFVTAAVVLVLSFVQPFVAAQATTTAVWLCVMHVVVAVPLAWFLSRSLPEVKAAPVTA